MTIRAVYENGVFRPTDIVDLPDNTNVVVELTVVSTDAATTPVLARIYEILSRRYDTGEIDLAERHNEHQP